MKFKGKWQLGGTILAGLLIGGKSAYAQQVDYEGLSELFQEPVTVSATGKPQRASESPVALEIITADEIRRMGVTSLPEVLGRVNGINNAQPMRSFSDVGIRGLNTAYNPNLLVLVNGRQVYIDVYGYTDWSLIPVQMEEIRQIEVIKSPATALYGFNAASGVINIITQNPLYDKGGEAGLVGGTGDYGRVYGFNTLTLSDDANIRFSASATTFNEYALRAKTVITQNGSLFREDNNEHKFRADGVFSLSDDTQLRVEGTYADAKNAEIVPIYNAILTDKYIFSGKTSLVSDTDFGLVEASIYNNSYQSEVTGFQNSFFKNSITVVQLQDLIKVGTDHIFKPQLEYRHNQMKSDELLGQGSTVAYDVIAAGGMWDWKIAPNVEWNNAVRVDHLMLNREGTLPAFAPYTGNEDFNQDITDYSINSGITWKATPVDSFRLAYGRGLQAPSLQEFGYLSFLFNSVITGNPSLEPTITHHYELGYNRQVEAINGKLTSSLFYKRTEDVNAFAANLSFNGFTPVLRADSIGNTHTTGLELGAEGKIHENWNWDLAYAFQNTMDDLTPYAGATPSPVARHFEDIVPHHVLKGHVGYTTGPWEADAYGEITSGFTAIQYRNFVFDYKPMDGYYTLGGRVAYAFENDITLALLGSNLQSARTANNYGLENERVVFLKLSKEF